jgi:hypothetical protein
MTAKKSLSVSLALAFVALSGCAIGGSQARPGQGTTPAPGGSVVPQAPSAGQPGAGQSAQGQPAARRTVASVTRTAQRHDGLFTVYQDTANGSLHMLVPKESVGQEFIYFIHVVEGPVTAGMFRGRFGTNNVFVVRRHFNRLEFVTQNIGSWFDPQNPLARAEGANISPAVVATQEIVAEDDSSYLIRADDIFLTEALTQIKPSPSPTPGGPPRFTLGTLSRGKTRVVAVRNYPANTDVIVEYVYENPAPVVRGERDVTDARNVSISVQHSLIQMPENGYTPRYDDPRVGYFTERRDDMLSARSAPYRDLITRWSLVKQDASAAISEPVEPIVWWIENTTPHEFRDAIAQGVLRWNEAFEAAGFRNAMQVRVQPDDADWDAGDIRYNVLRWTSSPTPPFGGYGPSFVNPRTGQILGADIMLEYVYVTNRVRDDRLFDRAALGLTADEGHEEHDPTLLCSYGQLWQSNLMLGRQVLEARGAVPFEIEELTRQGIVELVMHEVGHTLGLNHNMKASQAVSRERVHDRSYTERHGVMGSVMDYSAINVAPAGRPQGEYYMTRAGPYDVWAIQFGYMPSLEDSAAERERVRLLLARSTEPALAFGNDGDDMRSPGRGIDPRVMVGDLTDDAVGYMTDRFELVDGLLGNLLARYATRDDSYHELRAAYLVLSGQQANAANVISRYIGGVYVDRAMVGQPGATRPFTPVSRADQIRAMRTLERYVFAADAFDSPAALYAHLQMQRRGFGFFGSTEDPKIHSRVLAIQTGVLNHLLHARVLTRLTDTRQYGNEYPVTEMMSDLTRALFAADARGNVNTFRQQIQLEYVTRLAAMITPPTSSSFDYPSKSAALANLRSIQRMLRGKSGVNAETAAHTQHVLFAIERALSTD